MNSMEEGEMWCLRHSVIHSSHTHTHLVRMRHDTDIYCMVTRHRDIVSTRSYSVALANVTATGFLPQQKMNFQVIFVHNKEL